VPSSSDRLLIGSGADGLAPLRMSLLLSSPPQGDEPDGTRQQLRQEQRTLAEIDDRIASQLEVNEKIRRLEEYQLMLKERIVQLDQRKPAPASAAAKQSEAAAQRSAARTSCSKPSRPGHRLWPGWRQYWQAWAH
jgi:TolA-binding protein